MFKEQLQVNSLTSYTDVFNHTALLPRRNQRGEGRGGSKVLTLHEYSFFHSLYHSPPDSFVKETVPSNSTTVNQAALLSCKVKGLEEGFKRSYF